MEIKKEIKKYFLAAGFLSAVLVFFVFAPPVSASRIYLEPAAAEYSRNDIFVVDVKLDTEGENINAVRIDLTFPKDVLEASDFSKGNSILTFWAQEPIFSNQAGEIHFVGGSPGGYDGNNAFLGKIIFKAIKGGEAKIHVDESSRILLNDGLGTQAKLSSGGSVFNILPEKSGSSADDWKEILENDKNPPLLFDIKITKDPSIFDGKYFIVFSTVDEETGVDYYEIKEGSGDWKKKGSPYLLEDQGLKSIIKVRAVDKAGNAIIAQIIPLKQPFSYPAAIIVLTGVAALVFVLREIRTNKKNEIH